MLVQATGSQPLRGQGEALEALPQRVRSALRSITTRPDKYGRSSRCAALASIAVLKHHLRRLVALRRREVDEPSTLVLRKKPSIMPTGAGGDAAPGR